MKLNHIKLCENLNLKNLDDLSVVKYLHDEILKALLEDVITPELEREEYESDEEYEDALAEEITGRVEIIIKEVGEMLDTSLYGHNNSNFVKMVQDKVKKQVASQ